MFGSAAKHGQKGMVRSVHKLLDEADAVCHFNGIKFDIPQLHKEFLLHGLPPPSPFRHIDLLRTCRRQFAFASNRLDFVSKLLGEGAKMEHKGMELWAGCMAGDPACLKTMELYNKQDVRLTERLYERLKPWIIGHPNVAQFDELAGRCCPTCGSKKLQARGVARTATITYQRFQCRDCGKWSRTRKADASYGKPELVAA